MPPKCQHEQRIYVCQECQAHFCVKCKPFHDKMLHLVGEKSETKKKYDTFISQYKSLDEVSDKVEAKLKALKEGNSMTLQTLFDLQDTVRGIQERAKQMEDAYLSDITKIKEKQQTRERVLTKLREQISAAKIAVSTFQTTDHDVELLNIVGAWDSCHPDELEKDDATVQNIYAVKEGAYKKLQAERDQLTHLLWELTQNLSAFSSISVSSKPQENMWFYQPVKCTNCQQVGRPGLKPYLNCEHGAICKKCIKL
jgi:hypothetical protein